MPIPSVESLVAKLEAALRQPEHRAQLIDEFQQAIFNAPAAMPKTCEWEILGELAYDLEFYEPNPRLRVESTSYYGDERVEQEIISALEKLRDCHTSSRL